MKDDALEREFEDMSKPITTIDDALTKGETKGSFSHEECGGTINWVGEGRSKTVKRGWFRAWCDSCDWSCMT